MEGVEIKRLILGYPDHLEDFEYAAGIVTAVDRPTLDRLLIELLRSAEVEDVGGASLFLQDLVTLGHKHEKCHGFREGYYGSALDDLVTSPEHFIRKIAVGTIGKMGTASSLPVLHRAFHEL